MPFDDLFNSQGIILNKNTEQNEDSNDKISNCIPYSYSTAVAANNITAQNAEGHDKKYQSQPIFNTMYSGNYKYHDNQIWASKIKRQTNAGTF